MHLDMPLGDLVDDLLSRGMGRCVAFSTTVTPLEQRERVI